jgi:hypothetical protein
MYDDGELTAGEIAGVVGVGRSTLYENLSAYKDGGDCILVVYRNTRAGKVDDSNRRYGETGQSEKVQLEADRKWWNIAPAREPRLKGIVYVVNGTAARIRAVDPDGNWPRDDRGYADIPPHPAPHRHLGRRAVSRPWPPPRRQPPPRQGKDQVVPPAMTSTPGQQTPGDPPVIVIDGVPRSAADLKALAHDQATVISDLLEAKFAHTIDDY